MDKRLVNRVFFHSPYYTQGVVMATLFICLYNVIEFARLMPIQAVL